MSTLTAHAYLLVVAPVAIAAAIALVAGRVRIAGPLLASIGPVLCALTGVAAVSRPSDPPDPPFVGSLAGEGSYGWLASVESLRIGWAVDHLSGLMLLVVGVVALCVIWFSVGYMSGDAGWARYFALLSLFSGAMSLLVVADGFLGLFVGWELVGACSYLLIGFWYERGEAAAAAMKAFLTTRVGDVGLLVGLAVVWSHFGSLRFVDVLGQVDSLPAAVATAAALLLLVGAIGKSAQMPLHIWLPDAMQGPTPVSALIHAATMVAAGVYLVARAWPLFEASPTAQTVVLAVGVITALVAATAAVAQRDIKRVLAYSTISQLGFMFAALGAGAWVAAMFHLVTHAGFKALLFLAAGSVIHGCGTQDLREMGGLARTMRVTAVTWVIGAAALAGLPPLSGFFSKDEVIHAVRGESTLAAIALLLAAVLTAFYITRATLLAFAGRAQGHAHEGTASMTVPLSVLALLTIVLGAAASPIGVMLDGHAPRIDWLVAAASVAALVIGACAASVAVRGGRSADEALERRLGRTWSAMESGWGLDAFLRGATVVPALAASRAAHDTADRRIIDGAAEGLARLLARLGQALRRLETGDSQAYGSALGFGVIVLFVLAVWVGR